MTAKKKSREKSSNSKARIRKKNRFAIPRSFYIPRKDLRFVSCFYESQQRKM